MPTFSCLSRPRATAIATAFLIVSVQGGKPAAGQTVVTKPNWQTDQALSFVLTKTQERTSDGQKIDKTSSRTDFELKVTEATAQGYLVDLVYGSTTPESQQVDSSPLAQQLNDLSKGIRIVLNVDANGNLKGVKNWQDVKKAYAEAIKQISPDPPPAGMTVEEVSKYLANISKNLSTKAQIELACTRDVQLLFMCLGHSYEVGKPAVFKGKLPNPVPGGRELPALASFELVSTDPTQGIATIHFKQSLAGEEARKVLDDTVRTLERRAGKPLPDAAAVKDIKISDAAAFKVEIDSAWIKSAKHGRIVRAGEGYQKETSSLERKSGP
jgi:hypothetical protein